MDEEELHQWSQCQNVDFDVDVDVKPDLSFDIKVKVEDPLQQDESFDPEREVKQEEDEEEEAAAEWVYNENGWIYNGDETLTTTNWTELTTSDETNNEEIEQRASVNKYLMPCPVVGCTVPPFSKTKELKDHKIRCHSSYACPLCFITPFPNVPEYLAHTKTVHAEWNSTSRREYNCELCPNKRPYTGVNMWRHHIEAHLKKVPKKMRKTPGILKIHPCSLYDDEHVLPRPSSTLNDDDNNCNNEDIKPIVNSTTSENSTITLPPEIPTKLRTRRFICNFKRCTVEFPDNQSLADHKQSHKKPEVFTCPVEGCSLSYTTMRSFNQHVQQCQLQQPLICPVENCGREFPNIRSFSNHKQTHKKKVGYFPCPVEGCNRQLKKGKFGGHSHITKCRRLMQMRNGGQNPGSGVSGVKVLQNTNEGTTTKVKQEVHESEQEEPADSWPTMDLPLKFEMEEQQQDESGESVQSDPDPDPDFDPQFEPSETLEIPIDRRRGSAVCPLCSHPRFRDRIARRDHITSVHAVKSPGQYECELCPPELSSFLRLDMWRHHIDAHLNKVPRSLRYTAGILKIYPCALADPDDLNAAAPSTVVTTSLPLTSKRFICSFKKCHVEFKDSASLKEHEQGHKTPLTYHCPVEGCTRTFPGWGHFFKHLEKCEQESAKKKMEKEENQNQEDSGKVDDPEVEGMEVETDQHDEEEEFVEMIQTRNRSIKGDKNGMRRCPVEGCNRIIHVKSLNHHLGMCRLWAEKRQREECPKREIKERKPMETVECPVEGCTRILFRGQGYTMHVKKCRRDLEERQNGSSSAPQKNDNESQPRRKRGRPRKIVEDPEISDSEVTQVSSDPTTMVTDAKDYAATLETTPQEDLPSQIETQKQVTQPTGSKEETLSIVSEF